MEKVYILGIESSCDETAAAVFCDTQLCSNVIASQTIHSTYGGVIPELASRLHEKHISTVVDQALSEAKITKNQLSAIAFTNGPGLIGALMVGSHFAKGLAMGLNIPILPVHHLKAHILAHFIEVPNQTYVPPTFPFMCLTVSGGHTQIVLVKSPSQLEVLATTIDDAAGECFDKIAKMLGLPYPGGPVIDQKAQLGNPLAFKYPQPKTQSNNYSFSGIKTAVLYHLQREEKLEPDFRRIYLNDICASAQKTIVDYLLQRLIQLAREYNVKTIAIAGGVSANTYLRTLIEGYRSEFNIHTLPLAFCTDNAAMIAITGYYDYLEGKYGDLGVQPYAKQAL